MAEADPVLAALIAKLPPGGSVWPMKKRSAWLELMWRTFELVYEFDGEAIELPPFLSAAAAMVAATTSEGHAMPQAPVKAVRPFIIDREGFARRANGDRIMPGHVTDVLYDERGEGDLGAITWADNSRGVRGLTLEITAA